MKIVWRKRAKNDLLGMVAFVAQESPSGAARMYEQIEHMVSFLQDWPLMGRAGHKRGVRELVVPQTPYIVLYRRKGAVIYVLRVLHGRQRR